MSPAEKKINQRRTKRFMSWEWVEVIQCTACKWYLGGRRCKAFKRIPEMIWEGEHDHRTPYPGDGGIRFELRED